MSVLVHRRRPRALAIYEHRARAPPAQEKNVDSEKPEWHHMDASVASLRRVIGIRRNK